jgi:hypothetical protein
VIKANVHNFVFITAIAVIGFLVLRMLAKTGLANVPVVGQVLQLASAA